MLFTPAEGAFAIGVIPVAVLLTISFWLAYYSVSPFNDYLGCSFWVFCYVFLLICPVYQDYLGVFPWQDNYTKSTITYSWFIVFLFCFCFSIGWYFSSKSKNKNLMLADGVDVPLGNIYLLYFISFLGLIYAFSNLGGVGVVFSAREEVFAVTTGDVVTTMITQAALRIPLFVCSLVLFDQILKSNKVYSVKNRIIVYSTIALVVVINNPISTPRFWFGCVILSYFLVYLSNMKGRWNFIFILMNLFLLLIVFPLASVFRKTTDVSLDDFLLKMDLSGTLVLSPDYDAFQQVINSVVTVQEVGNTYGSQILSAIFFWIPRSIWSEKSYSSGQYIGESLNYSFTNLSSPLVSEMYLDFGIIGVVLLSSLLGWFYYRLSSLSYSLGSFLCFFTAYQAYLQRGTLMSTLGFLTITIMCYLILFRYRLGRSNF